MSAGVGIALGGVATIHCVHDREKRSLTTLPFDPSKTSLHLCACCENLFTERSDTPMFCPSCRGAPTHQLRADLPAPIGRV